MTAALRRELEVPTHQRHPQPRIRCPEAAGQTKGTNSEGPSTAGTHRSAPVTPCRPITRLALSDERIQPNAARQVELRLTTPWRDRTTHPVMSRLEFMQLLAALVPQPRLRLIRFPWGAGTHATLRPGVVPKGLSA